MGIRSRYVVQATFSVLNLQPGHCQCYQWVAGEPFAASLDSEHIHALQLSFCEPRRLAETPRIILRLGCRAAGPC
jgi:hypothetical protein